MPFSGKSKITGKFVGSFDPSQMEAFIKVATLLVVMPYLKWIWPKMWWQGCTQYSIASSRSAQPAIMPEN